MAEKKKATLRSKTKARKQLRKDRIKSRAERRQRADSVIAMGVGLVIGATIVQYGSDAFSRLPSLLAMVRAQPMTFDDEEPVFLDPVPEKTPPKAEPKKKPKPKPKKKAKKK